MMAAFSMKGRFLLLLWSIVMIAMSSGGSYIGYLSVEEYLSFPEEVFYSNGLVSLILSFVIMAPFNVSGIYVFIKGERMHARHQIFLFKIMIFAIIASVLCGFLFKTYYISELKSKGYFRCAGVPSGWMPGMAVKYSSSPVLCHQ
ncbi:DUF1240 domain-containing protein [Erwinia sp. AnSW2-5]|uniref:DUF1240 domain-containing protein n=1 Tax=Erwinia sp. AnSW2-5 TaxID=3367692 RepID=UPI00385B6F9B